MEQIVTLTTTVVLGALVFLLHDALIPFTSVSIPLAWLT